MTQPAVSQHSVNLLDLSFIQYSPGLLLRSSWAQHRDDPASAIFICSNLFWSSLLAAAPSASSGGADQPSTFSARDTLVPVLSGSTCTDLTLPSSRTSAYRLDRSLPKMALPSKSRSSAWVSAPEASAKKRICSPSGECQRQPLNFGGGGGAIGSKPRARGRVRLQLTPLVPAGSSDSPQAFILRNGRGGQFCSSFVWKGN